MKLHRSVSMFLPLAFAMVFPAGAWAQEGEAQSAPQPANQGSLDEVVVLGEFVPDEKRMTSEISSVLGAEDFAITGDSNIAQTLRRVTGLSLQDNRFVIIRGLNERYSDARLNGTAIPSPEPLRRVVSLDIFPTGFLSGALVQKTYSPQFPLDFGGGVMELRSVGLPEEFFAEASVSLTYDSATTFNNSIDHLGSYSDWISFDSGLRSFPDELQTDLTTLTPEQLEAAGESIPNFWSINNEDAPINGSGSLSIGNRWDFSDSSLGVIAVLDYGNSWQDKNGIRQTVTVSDAGITARDSFSPQACEGIDGLDPSTCGVRNTERDFELNGLLSVILEAGNDHKVQLNGLWLRKSTKESLIQQGFRANEGQIQQENRIDWVERSTWMTQATGEHFFNIFTDSDVLGDTEFNWRASFSEATRDVLGRKQYVYEYNDIIEEFLLNERALVSNQTAWGALKDQTFDGGFDITQPFDVNGFIFDINAGFAYTNQDRESNFRRFFFQNAPGFAGNFDLRRQVPEIIYGSVNVDPNGFVLRESSDVSEAFSAEMENIQFYAQIDAQLTPTLRVAAGFRYEDSEQITISRARSNILCAEFDTLEISIPSCEMGGTIAFQSGELVPIRLKGEFLLPAATATWEFAPNHQLRFAFSQTIDRPSLRELSTSPFLDPERDELVEGNPFLEIAELNNFDVRWEWYFSGGQFLTVGAFYKEIKNPIERSFDRVADTNQRTWINGDKAELWGIEVEGEVDVPLNEWWEFLGNREFFLRANATYVDAEVTISELEAQLGNLTDTKRRLQGQSDWLANLQFGYYDPTVQERAAILVNFTGKRIESVGTFGAPNSIENPPLLLDFVYSRIFEIWGGEYKFSLEVRNILGEDFELTQGPIITETYSLGTTVQLGITATY